MQVIQRPLLGRGLGCGCCSREMYTNKGGATVHALSLGLLARRILRMGSGCFERLMYTNKVGSFLHAFSWDCLRAGELGVGVSHW